VRVRQRGRGGRGAGPVPAVEGAAGGGAAPGPRREARHAALQVRQLALLLSTVCLGCGLATRVPVLETVRSKALPHRALPILSGSYQAHARLVAQLQQADSVEAMREVIRSQRDCGGLAKLSAQACGEGGGGTQAAAASGQLAGRGQQPGESVQAAAVAEVLVGLEAGEVPGEAGLEEQGGLPAEDVTLSDGAALHPAAHGGGGKRKQRTPARHCPLTARKRAPPPAATLASDGEWLWEASPPPSTLEPHRSAHSGSLGRGSGSDAEYDADGTADQGEEESGGGPGAAGATGAAHALPGALPPGVQRVGSTFRPVFYEPHPQLPGTVRLARMAACPTLDQVWAGPPRGARPAPARSAPPKLSALPGARAEREASVCAATLGASLSRLLAGCLSALLPERARPPHLPPYTHTSPLCLPPPSPPQKTRKAIVLRDLGVLWQRLHGVRVDVRGRRRPLDFYHPAARCARVCVGVCVCGGGGAPRGHNQPTSPPTRCWAGYQPPSLSFCRIAAAGYAQRRCARR
jgi:hypothetical protein